MADPNFTDPVLGGEEIHGLAEILIAEIKKGDTRKLMKLLETTLLYADPGFYHGVLFDFYSPCGGFDDDFDFDEDYNRQMPGKLARETILSIRGEPK